MTRALAVVAALGVAAAAAGLAWSRRAAPPEAPPPVLYPLPEFTLVERSGRPLTLDTLRGRPFVAGFIFTRCGGVCPRLTRSMSELRAALPGAVRLVSFTVDPAHDTPAVLARYAEPLQAGERWLFATGPREELYRLSIDGFKLAAMEVPAGQAAEDGPFLHSAKLALVDASARVRGYYDSDDPAALAALARDAARLEGGR